MNTELLFQNIHKHIILDEKEQEFVQSLLEEVKVRKNDFILRCGDPCSYINFVNAGTLRAFYLSPGGKDSTVMFAIKDWWITDMHSFVNEIPALVHIQAVENCNLLRLSKANLDRLYKDLPKFNTFFRILMQNAYCREQLRTIQNLSLPAKDRHHQFLEKYPHIARKLTQKQIASYLGVTPEFLSTIRSQKN